MIRPATIEDAPHICDIYNHYIAHTAVTFEEEPVSADTMSTRISETAASLPWIVNEDGGTILGYACAARWKERRAYRFSVESTVYVKKDAVGRGIGTELLRHLLEEIKAKKIHAVVAGIALPNERSLRLHEKCGFRKVAHFAEVGFKFNKWIDVGYWELVLDEKEVPFR